MESAAKRLRVAIIAVAVCIVLAGCAYAAWTYFSLHKDTVADSDYYVSSSDTVLQVNTNASVYATEQRVYTLNEDTGCVVWDLNNMKSRQNLQMQSVKISEFDESGQPVRTQQLVKIPFSKLWRDDIQSLDSACYAVDTDWAQLYVFSPFSAGKIMITVEYIVKETVVPYRDVSEVLWTVVPGSSSTTTYDASLQVILPVPAGTSDASESVFAWEHGPEDAQVSVTEDGMITYTVPETQVWQYAEVRFDFPTSWMTNLSDQYAQTYSNQLRLENVLIDEAKWTDSWHERSINSYTFDMGFILVCLILLALSVALYARYGRPRMPDYTKEHFAQPPYLDEPIHPSCVGQIWRWNRRRIFDLHAALDYLVLKGAVTVTEAPGAGEAMGYVIARNRAFDEPLKPIDEATMELLFGAVAGGADQLTAQQLRDFREQHQQAYQDAVEEWQKSLVAVFDQDRYFERGGRRWQIRLLLLALLVAAVGLGMFLLFGHPVLLVSALVTAAAMALIANYLPRRTPYGNNITARAKALRKWIKSSDSDLTVTGPELAQLMPYACLLDLKGSILAKADAFLPADERLDVSALDDLDQLCRVCYVTALLRGQDAAQLDQE